MLAAKIQQVTGERPPSVSSVRQKFLRKPTFWIGALIVLGFLLFCFLGPILDPSSPLTSHPGAFGQPPSLKWPLGTDDIGRNEMIRLMYGGRLMLLIGLLSAIISTTLGFWVGVLSGFYGGLVDRLLSWTMDIVTSVPQLVPLLLFEVLVGASPTTMIVVVSLTSWPFVGRPVRAEVMSLSTREFIMAAGSLGASRRRIIVRHLLPNLWSTLLTTVTSSFGTAILVIATASFLGFSLPAPNPNWGSMIAHGIHVIYDGYWWLWVLPTAFLILLQLAVHFMAVAARESLNSQSEVAS
ncbi:ABC transporter permease [Alicyclobacillus sp. SO9]|uniref:ABC transporter permease n=1 Tax=Alicyclobacillus sp. SO9 TaxID=2665646 RepID=UPI0018E85935|nr:ABC transporter permease [Alicyclobacillus sp. SO9]QQE77632.1 ABC transporter permease [Alicyclobacillus sp. SO9]